MKKRRDIFLNSVKRPTFKSLCITFPECMYFVALNNWYMMNTLWISFNIFPFLITLCKSVSAIISDLTDQSFLRGNCFFFHQGHTMVTGGLTHVLENEIYVLIVGRLVQAN